MFRVFGACWNSRVSRCHVNHVLAPLASITNSDLAIIQVRICGTLKCLTSIWVYSLYSYVYDTLLKDLVGVLFGICVNVKVHTL